MARKRRHQRRYRGLGAMVKIPGLGTLNKQVNSTDVLVGAALGLGGTLALKGLGNKFLAGTAPDWLLKGSPLVGGAITGAALYFLGKGKNSTRANAHLFGALTAGASVQAWDVLKTTFPTGLGDVVSLRLGRGYRGYGNRSNMGVFVNEQTPRVGPGAMSTMNGMIVNDPQKLSDYNLGQLAQMSMGDSDVSGMEELMGLE